ncbi:MAG: ABC transporter ATP-binding protein [Anaerolineaceae bacterium]|nr:ABC transporter ATP-binding protein [Anaerolineaceae bacterium]
MLANNVIQVNDLQRSLSHGGRELHILRGITFSVAERQWVALTGPSGSGKTTLLSLLAGIDRPTRGSIYLDGMEISHLSEDQLARFRNDTIGIVFQSFHLIPTMTAQENVETPLYIGPRRREARQLARQMLERVGLADRLHHMPYQLSGGEQQRVAIARALVSGPRVLLADEPTGNLDSATSKQVLTLLKELRTQLNLTVVMVTHDPQVASWGDRRLHMIDGRLVDIPEAQATLDGELHYPAGMGV